MKTKEIKEKRINVFEVVNIDKETNEISVLDELFDRGDGFKRAMGIRFIPISKAEYKERTSKKEVIEKIMDCYTEALNYNRAEKIYKEIKQACELTEFVFDLSYRELWNKLREHGFNQKEYPIFECIGYGRMFDADFKGNINTHLSEKIREYEKR